MGIGLTCEDTECFYSYTFWNDVRIHLAKAAIQYLKIIKTTLPRNGDLDDLVTAQPKAVFSDMFLFHYELFGHYRSVMTCNGLEGIFALLDRGHTEGEYSIGNCHDIVRSIKTVKHCIQDPDVMDAIPELIKVFEAGIRLGKNVQIS
jgi:hypothetical protein